MDHDTGKMAFSIAEVCATTSLGKTKVFEEIKFGRLKVVRVGGRTLVLAADLSAWLSQYA